MIPIQNLAGGADNSFEHEVEPIQAQLENRFHQMEGVLPPPGVQSINGLGSEHLGGDHLNGDHLGGDGGLNGMNVVMPPLNPVNPTMQLM